MAKVIMTTGGSESIRRMVTFTLEQAGHSVVEVVDGKDAADKLSGIRFWRCSINIDERVKSRIHHVLGFKC